MRDCERETRLPALRRIGVAVRGTTVDFELTAPTYGTAMIADDDSVWIAVQPNWSDLATWIWWWLCPSDRKSYVTITVGDGVGGVDRVRTRAVRVAKKHVRVRNLTKSML